MRNRILIGGAVVVVAFLVGFVPQFVEARRLRTELTLATERNAGAELRDLAALTYVQANRKNYGLAAETAARLFERIREAASQTSDAASRAAFDAILARRDAVTGKLATGDAAVMDDLNEIFVKTREATRPPSAI